MARVRSLGALLLLLGGCSTASDGTGTELWAADLQLTHQVLIMTLVREDSELNGTGTLALLTSPAGEALVLSGTRIADTVEITFTRQGGAAPFRFAGWYVSNGTLLRGVLDGAEFSAVNLTFRRR